MAELRNREAVRRYIKRDKYIQTSSTCHPKTEKRAPKCPHNHESDIFHNCYFFYSHYHLNCQPQRNTKKAKVLSLHTFNRNGRYNPYIKDSPSHTTILCLKFHCYILFCFHIFSRNMNIAPIQPVAFRTRFR